MERPISTRLDEARRRPEAIAKLEASIKKARGFATVIKAATTVTPDDKPPHYTTEEIAELERIITEHADWLSEKQKLQDAKQIFDDPVLRIGEMDSKTRRLDDEVTKLTNKRPPTKRKLKPVVSGEAKVDDELPSSSSTASGSESTPSASADDAAPTGESKAPVGQETETNEEAPRDEL